MTIRRSLADTGRILRDPPPPVTRMRIGIRAINMAWGSIDRSDLDPGELVFNVSDGNLVYRLDNDEIFRYAPAATRTI